MLVDLKVLLKPQSPHNKMLLCEFLQTTDKLKLYILYVSYAVLGNLLKKGNKLLITDYFL